MRLVLCVLVALLTMAQARAPLTTVKIIFTPDDAAMPAIWAQKMGMFERAGLDVQIEKSRNGTAATAAVMGGAFDIAEGSLIASLNAHVKGLPLQFIAEAGAYDDKAPNVQFLVAKDSTIQTGADLNGKTLGSPALNDLASLGAKSWVDKHGGDSTTLQFVEVPASAMGAALEAHRIAAASVSSPAAEAALATTNVRSLGSTYAAIAPHFMLGGWFTTAEWARAHPDVITRFVRVIAEASTYVDAHTTETAPVLSDFTGVPVAVILKMQRTIHPQTVLRAQDIQPIIDAAAKYKLIPRAFSAQELITH